MTHAYAWVVVAFWFVFLGYWTFLWPRAKQDVRRESLLHSWIPRLVVLAILLEFALRHSSVGEILTRHIVPESPAVGWTAAALTALGVAFAVWARAHLGRNWSSRPAMKQGHELVTTGPYALVRHPIYTGLLLALIGSALINSIFWIVAFIVMASTFLRRISVEERYMLELFPDEYPAYQARTKRLIPYVW